MKRSAEPDENIKEKNLNETKKIAFGLKKKDVKDSNILLKKKVSSNISIKLTSTPTSASPAPTLQPKVGKAALAFSQDEDEDEDEEMPPEAKMRMKNIGRDTPTSSGPNSFGKSRMGFCDSKKMYEKQMKEIQDQLEKK